MYDTHTNAAVAHLYNTVMYDVDLFVDMFHNNLLLLYFAQDMTITILNFIINFFLQLTKGMVFMTFIHESKGQSKILSR